ncbi:hypothetical protein [Micromonospora cremea]|uniref:Uncharacterized protein n=1 Tax=Micromonospora cremea TaxID=709881 RepID=A0A1N6B563_9ACTN|nr:hypothetical protein [Micromonospora cremea]SIN41224.1 hypothetical protein SAMN04489832_6685 [Micromonospora cremea]
MTVQLTYTGHLFINFANQTFQWVHINRFGLPATDEPDVALLAALTGHDSFGDNYATGPGPGGDPERHGPYWRDQITPDCYDLIEAGIAERCLRSWAEQFAPVPGRVRPELQRAVYQPLHAADRVYQLRDLGPAAFHDWGGVHNDFHEFVLVDRTSRTLAQIVAADD